jgi:porin
MPIRNRELAAVIVVVVFAACAGTMAVDATSRATSEPAATSAPAREANAASAIPWLVTPVDYSGDIWHRPTLSGDWGGARQTLMDHGIKFDFNLTQTLQGNWDGGSGRGAFYQGGMRYNVDLDTGHMGLWTGGMFHLRGETPFGLSDNANSGALMPVNTDALYPVPGKDTTCLSEAYYVQFVAPWLGFMAGKMSPRDENVFAHDETTQFMNTAFFINPIIGIPMPTVDMMGGGVLFIPVEWFKLSTLVLDTEGSADVSGFETVFKRATTVYQMAEATIKPLGQEGHQRVSWAWSDKANIDLQQDPFALLKQAIKFKLGLGPAPTLTRDDETWTVCYDFDQYVYTKPGTKDQGIGLFGRFGTSDEGTNPIGQFYSLGVGGKGMIPSRDNDTFGVGYYYLHLSDELGPIVRRFVEDEQGVEMYYNIAVTPWLHVSPDLQVIDPGKGRDSDTAVVAGIRMRIDF